MKPHTKTLIHNLETSRKVGWAKYYALQTENQHQKWLIRLLLKRIIHHPRLNNNDPLIQLAQELQKTF